MGDTTTGERAAPRRTGRVAGAVFNYGLGSYVPQIVSFLLVPLYTRYIAPAEMGVLEICLTAQILVTVLMRFGLPGAIARLYFDVGEGDRLRDVVTTVALTVTAIAAALLAAALLVGPMVLARVLPEIPFHPYMDLALVAAFLQVAPDLQRRLLQAREQSALSARLSAGVGVLAIVLNLVFVIGFRMAARGVLLANLIAAAVFAVIAWYLHRDDLRGRFRAHYLREALSYGVPLVPHHVAAWANQFAGRWVLGAHATAGILGQLSLAARVASPLGVVTGAFSNAYSPVYFSWRSQLTPAGALAEARRIARGVLVLGTVAVVGAATLGAVVIRHLMAPAYAPAASLVGLIAAALFSQLVYTLVSTELFFSKRTSGIAVVFVTSAALNLLLVYLLVDRYGAFAAAAGQLAGGLASIAIVSRLALSTFPSPLEGRAVAVALAGNTAACLLPLWPMRLGLVGDVTANVVLFVLIAGGVILASGAAREMYTDTRALFGRRWRGGAGGEGGAPAGDTDAQTVPG